MSEVEDTFKELIQQFHQKMDDDTDANDKLQGKEVKMEVDVTGDFVYHFHLKDGKIVEFGQGGYDKKDCKVTMSTETFQMMQNQEISPMKAFMTKKIAFEGSMSHLLLMRGVLTGE